MSVEKIVDMETAFKARSERLEKAYLNKKPGRVSF